MTAIGPGLFWCLFGYFAINATLAAILTAAKFELRQDTYVTTMTVGAIFVVWLGVAR